MILLSEMENLFAQLIVGPAATEQRQITLLYLRELWPQNIMEANIGHLPTKFGFKQAYMVGKLSSVSLAGKHSHLTSFDLWFTYVTFDPRISWRPI